MAHVRMGVPKEYGPGMKGVTQVTSPFRGQLRVVCAYKAGRLLFGKLCFEKPEENHVCPLL